jgi:hypothetical protein
MRRIRTLTGLSLLIVAVMVAAVPSAGAANCKLIHAQFIQTLVTADCPSPIGVCTTAHIDSGLLKGTKTFMALGAAPTAGLGEVEAASTFSYAGPVVIATEEGELNVSFVGVLDNANAFFSELGRPMGGTGRFAGATGILFVSGYVTGEGTVFNSTMTGEVCLAS